ncbi:hypothetical protein Bca4012_094582 [Brassica carinata]
MHRRISSAEKGKAVALDHRPAPRVGRVLKEVARSIDDDIGTFEVADITPQAIRMRVHVNGRLPLIKTTIVEFSSAGEVSATLQYEKLERHCLKCGRLDHEIRDCLEAKHEKKAQLAAQQEVSIRSRASVTNNELPFSKDKLHSGGSTRFFPRRNHKYEPYSRNDHSYRTEYDRTKEPLRRRNSTQDRYSKECYPREDFHQARSRRDQLRGYDGYHGYRRSPPRRDISFISGESHSVSSPKPQSWRDDHIRPSYREDDRNLTHRSTESPTGIPEDIPKAPTPQTTRTATNDQLEEAAAILAHANMAHSGGKEAETTSLRPSSQGRLSATQRLGSASSNSGSLQRLPASQRFGSPLPITGSQDRLPASSRLGLPNPVEPAPSARVPIMDRLGPLLDELDTDELSPVLSTQAQKRKPGRPPGKKKIQSSPLALPGAT